MYEVKSREVPKFIYRESRRKRRVVRHGQTWQFPRLCDSQWERTTHPRTNCSSLQVVTTLTRYGGAAWKDSTLLLSIESWLWRCSNGKSAFHRDPNMSARNWDHAWLTQVGKSPVFEHRVSTVEWKACRFWLAHYRDSTCLSRAW